MDRRTTVSIPCNTARSPDWVFISRILGRTVSPQEGWDEERAASELRKLLGEAIASQPERIFSAFSEMRTDDAVEIDRLPGLKSRLLDLLSPEKKDGIGRRYREVAWSPRHQYLSDHSREVIDRAIQREQYEIDRQQTEDSLRIDGIRPPTVEPLKDEDLMPFGRYVGEKLKNVPAGYLDEIASQPWISKHPRLEAYIRANSRAISKELRDLPDEGLRGERDCATPSFHK